MPHLEREEASNTLETIPQITQSLHIALPTLYILKLLAVLVRRHHNN